MSDLLNFYYRIIWAEFQGTDALYEDYIIHLIGTVGLNALRDYRLLETCGVVNGRQLYALCPATTLKGRLTDEN
jgi:hypothetical protein